MATELLYLAAAAALGGYIALATAEGLSVHFNHRHLTSYASYCPIWSIIVAVPLFLAVRSKHYWLHKNRIHGTQPAAIYPHTDPIFGLDWLRRLSGAIKKNQMLQVLDSNFRTVGDTYWARYTGSWAILTNEPENIKAMLSTQFESWPIGSVRQMSSVVALGPHAIFSVNGAEWQRSRALIRPSFVRNQLADLECTDRHVETFLGRLGGGGKLDLQELLYLFTMDVSTDFMFGHSTNTLIKPTQEALAFTSSFEYALLSASTRSRLGALMFLIPDKKLDAAVATCHSFIDQYIAEALAAKDKAKERSYVFMDEMLASGAPRVEVREQLLAMILGGRDTSASTLSSLFWMMARREDVVRKMRAEVEGLGGRRPTWEELKNMKYMNMVLKEALRLWSPVPTNFRNTNKDVVLPKGGGPDGHSPLFVPKGTGCRFSLYSLHRRRDVYGEDADEFRPERWETLRSSWEYLPFSGGPRICIGQQFALTQMLYLLARTLQTFKSIKAEDDLPMEQRMSTTIQLAHGCWVSLTPA